MSHIVSFYFFAGGEVCSGTNTVAKGSRFQPVLFPRTPHRDLLSQIDLQQPEDK